MGAGKGAARLVALLVAASVLAVIPSCSVDANTTTTLPIKPKASPPLPGDTSPTVGTIFQLQGNVYPKGRFYVEMSIGNSHNLYSMHIDTGSGVTWVKCKMPTQAVYPRPPKDKMIPCDDPRCKAVLATTGSKKCVSKKRCDYQILYEDESYTEGVLIADTMTLELTNGTTIHPTVAFGCGRWRTEDEPLDGLLGLGFANIGILSQLSSQGLFREVTGHCLKSRGGGLLFLGDGQHPPSGITWAPMTRSKFYSLGPASLFWDSQPLVSSPRVLLDSGTTYTYFGLDSYNSFISALDDHVRKQRLTRDLNDVDANVPYCWSGPQKFRSIVDAQRYFKNLELRFANGAALMKLPPVNYLIISNKGNACLGILNGTQVIGLDRDLTLIGDISMLDRWVIYDTENRRLGWADTDDCRVSK